MKKKRTIIVWILFCCMIFTGFPVFPSQAKQEEAADVIHINVLDYGADRTGIDDSTTAIWEALCAAKAAEEDGKNQVVLDFPQGEYHIYKDKAQVREYHTSNTNSIQSPNKTIGILIEEHKNLTINGNDSLFIMHGNIMALAVVKSENVVLKDFSWDFAVPTVTEMTVMNMGEEEGRQFTDFYIPSCFPYEIQGNTIRWTSEKSPYTGEYYWTETGIHNAYCVVGYVPEEEMTRRYGNGESPFQNAYSVETIEDGVVRVTYNSTRPAMQKNGMVLELCSSSYRETAGAFTWESKQVTAENVNVHFMHGFGWLIQMSTNVYYKNCDFMPRENSGHITVGYADLIHASGAAGEIVIENCNFSNAHDDPINIHGTFTRVEQRVDDHTLQLKYIHTQQGGFPQYHVGDEVVFFTRDSLESTDGETHYTVEEVISNPGENGNDLRTMEIRFKEELPANLSERINGEPKYVAENVTYTPEVTVRNCTFRNIPTRGILCTTRNKVLIENNIFKNMSMATIYLSNDSDQWYESGPIRDMTIRNNVFYIKSIGQTEWEYASAIYVHPVTKGGGFPSQENPIHKNLTIEGNTFYMDQDTVVKAESVENLTIRNNKILRMKPDIEIAIEAGTDTMAVGDVSVLSTTANGSTNTRRQDNAYEFTKCKNVVLEGNSYDDGLKKYAVLSGMDEENLTNHDAEIKIVNNRDEAVSSPVSKLYYVSSDPTVVSVDTNGKMTAKAEGTAEVYAYYAWNGTMIKSNRIGINVDKQTGETQKIQIENKKPIVLKAKDEKKQLTLSSQVQGVQWMASDFLTEGETTAIRVDNTGMVTALDNGIAWVTARAGGAEDRIPVVVSLPEVEKLSPSFRLVNESKANYTVGDSSFTVDMQAGDLYNENNTVKNLLLYQGEFDSDNLRTIVKVDNLPTRENGQWDTASFFLYKDADNYISIGKKSHFDGIARVVEKAQQATETGGDAADNHVTAAYLGFSKSGNTVSLDFKVEDGEWKHLADVDSSVIGETYAIGFAAWETHDRSKKVTFSGFKVGTADMSYEELEAKEAVGIGKFKNEAPEAQNVRFEKESYQQNETVVVSYDFVDANGHAEGESLYLWSYEEDGIIRQVVTSASEFAARTKGMLTCEVYPVDEFGTPGIPVSAESEIGQSEQDLRLSQLNLNGIELLKEDLDAREFEVRIPADIQKVELSYQSAMTDEGNTEISVGGTVIGGTLNTDCLAVNVKDGDIITVTRKGAEEIVYRITVTVVESNETTLQNISLKELGFETEDFSAAHWYIHTKVAESSIQVTAEDSIGKIEITYGAGREPVVLEKEGNLYSGQVRFVNGLNSYYVQVTAKDGITVKQYIINVVYQAEQTAKLNDLKINGKSVKDFDSAAYEYVEVLDENAESFEIEAEAEGEVRIKANDVYVQGNTIFVDKVKTGTNEVKVIVIAPDGGKRSVYHVEVIKPHDANVDVFGIKVNGNDIFDAFNENGEAVIKTGEDVVTVEVEAKDSGAKIQAVSGSQEKTGIGSLTASWTIYKESPEIDITVTARDGKTKQSYHIDMEKGVYLSDLQWRGDSTVGYGEINKDKSSSGSRICLPDENGNPVYFEKGIGTHADSDIYFEIQNKGYEKIKGYVGIDYVQYNAEYGDVQFQIFADNELVYDSGMMNKKAAMKAFEADVTGAKLVTLKVLKGEHNWNDHADWADVQFVSSFKEKPTIEPETYTVSVEANDADMGEVTISPKQESYEEGTEIIVKATAKQGYEFVNWTAKGETVVLSTKAEYPFRAERNLELVANFKKTEEPEPEPETYTVSVEANDADMGEVTISPKQESYEEGTEIIVKATAKQGYEFVNWTEKGETAVLSTKAEYPFRAEKNLELVANFKKTEEPEPEPETYTVSVEANDADMGEVTISPKQESYEEGTEIIVKATAKQGYEFVNWTEKGETAVLSTKAEYPFRAEKNLELVANFKKTEEPEPEPPAESPFVDVRKGDWYYEQVMWAYENKIMTGYTDGSKTFGPANTLQRAEFAKLLYNYAKAETPEFKDVLVDVREGDWYAKAVIWAYNNEIITGYTDGSKRFGPSDNITREQVATILWRYAGKPGVKNTEVLHDFPDGEKVSEYAKTAVAWAVENKIIKGKDDGSLNPLGHANRAEAATIMQRAIPVLEEE